MSQRDSLRIDEGEQADPIGADHRPIQLFQTSDQQIRQFTPPVGVGNALHDVDQFRRIGDELNGEKNAQAVAEVRPVFVVNKLKDPLMVLIQIFE